MKVLHQAILTVIAFTFAIALNAQEPQTRSITSDDFAKKRPAEAAAGGPIAAAGQANKTGRVTYKFVRKEKNPIKPKTSKVIAKIAKPKKQSDIGVTIWKLRPPAKSDSGVKLPVQIDGGRQMWTPERVSLDTQFAPKDRVRLAVESSTPGFLYVVNNEMNFDDSLGEPCLLFPERPEDSNAVSPGMLVDFPDKTESLPYFLINPRSPKYKGELLTIIITPERIANLKTERNGGCLRVNIEDLTGGDTDADIEIFSRQDAANKTLSKAEHDSSCGSRQRGLERESGNSKPCGTNSRGLTREEPLPQSILRVRSETGKPTVAFIRLNVKH